MKTISFGKATLRIRQRDICIMDFPLSDGTASKARPTLVISRTDYNDSQSDILTVPLTTKIRLVPYSICLSDSDLEEGHLKEFCRVKCDKIVSMEKSLIIRKVGRLNPETFERVKTEIFAVLAE